MRGGVVGALLVVSSAWGCGPAERPLLVDLRTDLVPGREVEAVTLVLDGEPVATAQPGPEDDWVGGVRLAELTVAEGDHTLRAVLTRGDQAVLERSVQVRIDGPTSVTVVASRDCRGVACPAAGDAAATACLGGVCVRPECTPENREACPEPACAVDADCPAPAACASARCVDGTCLADEGAACAGGLFCDAERGCVAAPTGCLEWGEYDPPTEMEALNAAGNDFAGWLSPDGLRFYFASERGGGEGGDDLYVATRLAVDQDFESFAAIDGLNTAGNDSDPFLSVDERELYFHRSPSPTVLMVARRADPTGDFEAPEVLAIDSAVNDLNPALGVGDLELFFTRDEGGPLDLFRATRSEVGRDFSDATRIASLATSTVAECCPALEPDGLRLVWESPDGMRAATRPTTDADFGPSEDAAEFDRDFPNGDPVFGLGGAVLIFSSQRGDTGNWDMYMTTRECLR